MVDHGSARRSSTVRRRLSIVKHEVSVPPPKHSVAQPLYGPSQVGRAYGGNARDANGDRRARSGRAIVIVAVAGFETSPLESYAT